MPPTTTSGECPLLGARSKPFGVATLTPHAQKAVLEAPAFEVLLELSLHVGGQGPLFGGALSEKGGVVPLDDLIEQRVLGLVTRICRRRGRSRGGASLQGARARQGGAERLRARQVNIVIHGDSAKIVSIRDSRDLRIELSKGQ